ncbi:MAG: hypothetical protein E7013_01400 [Alphaproteobacteria bacterium]|nr:hypothetical protein [Alphaproteobacteria bacterium]
MEWAIVWPDFAPDAFQYSYCNTIPTPQGGTHETELRAGLTKSLRAYAEMVGCKKAEVVFFSGLLTAFTTFFYFLTQSQNNAIIFCNFSCIETIFQTYLLKLYC